MGVGSSGGAGGAGGVCAWTSTPPARSEHVMDNFLRLVICSISYLEFLSGRLRGRYILVPDIRAQHADLEEDALGFEPLTQALQPLGGDLTGLVRDIHQHALQFLEYVIDVGIAGTRRGLPVE